MRHPSMMSGKLRRSLRRYNVAAAVLLLAACGEDPTIAGVVVRVEISPDRDTLVVGEVGAPFVATAFNARDDTIPGADITWSSDQPFIARVDSLTGTVVAVTTGAAALTARAGAVSDTAQVFIVGPLTLPMDTILLFPGDTFTIPVNIRQAATTPTVRFRGGSGSVATLDSVTGLLTAVDFGTAGFTVLADTFAQQGAVQVLNVPDTTLGNVYLSMSGARNRQFRLVSRAFNHPTRDGRTVFNLNSESFDGGEQFALLLLDSLTTVRQDALGELPESATAQGADPVCFPPASFAFYRDLNTVRRARSLNGSVAITAIRDVPGGRAVSGRLEGTLQFLDDPDSTGVLTVRATFLVPVVTLTPCPQAAPPAGSPAPHTRHVGPAAGLGTRRR